LDRGTVLGLVVNAEGNSPLAGVLVEASGVFDQPPNYRIYLPLVLKGANSGLIALPPPAVAANFAPDGGGVFTTTTTADGSFTLPVPAGAYTLTLTLAITPLTGAPQSCVPAKSRVWLMCACTQKTLSWSPSAARAAKLRIAWRIPVWSFYLVLFPPRSRRE